MHSRFQSAFTLLEILCVIMIVSLLTLIAVPLLQHQLQQYEAHYFLGSYKTALMEARNTALSHQQTVILCGSQTGKTCDNHWQNGLLLFIDSNHNKDFDALDKLLFFQPQSFRHGTIELHAFGTTKTLIYTPERGIPLASNASFYYCSHDNTLNRALIMSRLGHVRPSSDNNHDGLHETNTGNPIICSG